MANLVGSEGSSGKVCYQGIEEAMKIDNVKIHLYGKKQTKPNRKMGHATITDTDLNEGLRKAKEVKKLIQIKTK